MSKRKKKKTFKKNLILFVFLLSVIGIYFSLNIKIIGDSLVYLNVNDKYFENGYKATLFGKKYNNVTIDSNINNTKLGKYKVTYTMKYLLFKRSITRIVEVVDNEKPIITLEGEDYITINKYQKYNEPGYSASDNLDGDITNKVKVTNNIDSNTLGKYEIIYNVKDKANNEFIIKRIVEVTDSTSLVFNTSFRIDGYFDNIILKPEDKEYDYINDTVFLGDSNILYLYSRGKFVDYKQVWGKNNLNIAQINASTFTTLTDKKEKTLKEAMDINKPKILLLTTGINSILYMNENDYKVETKKFIKYMKENYKDTQVVFLSTFPLNEGTISANAQKKINKYNYFLAEICNEEKINYINFADQIRNEEGLGDDKYYNCSEEADCNFHLNDLGKEKLIDYIKHLDLERKFI